MTEHRLSNGEGDEGAEGSRIKRRGLIAGAAALVAGIAAKRAEQPVEASSFANLVATGPAPSGVSIGVDAYTNSLVVFDTGVSGNGKNIGVVGVSYNSGNTRSTGGFFQGNNNGIQAMLNNSSAPQNWTNAAVAGWGAGGAGVIGVSGESDSNLGVYGYSASFHAVYGNTNAPFTGVGVFGSGAGVFGSGANARGAGVVGNGGIVGVHGECSTAGGVGVRGQSTAGIGVSGTTSGTGVVAGVYGTSSTAYGIIGGTTAAGYSGLTAITNTPNVAALGATSTVPNAYAAFFTGTTIVNGNFAVTGNKSAAVAHPDGTHRLLYCVESPEAWFEDFGEAKLVNGKADVTLDPDFAALVHADIYHVFLAEHGGYNGLHTTKKGVGGFTVEASPTLAKAAGTSTGQVQGTFSWRVVAKRKDNPGKRMEKFVLPTINHPDPDKLPKPEPPRKP